MKHWFTKQSVGVGGHYAHPPSPPCFPHILQGPSTPIALVKPLYVDMICHSVFNVIRSFLPSLPGECRHTILESSHRRMVGVAAGRDRAATAAADCDEVLKMSGLVTIFHLTVRSQRATASSSPRLLQSTACASWRVVEYMYDA